MALDKKTRRLRKVTEVVRQVSGKLNNPLAAEMYAHAVDKATNEGDDTFLKFLSNLEQFPVSIEEFIDSDEFLGATDLVLWSEVRKAAIDSNKDWWKGPNEAIRESIYSGSTGSGKTELAKIDAAYTLHLLGCLRNPQSIYGIPSATSIVFVLQSAKPHVTKKVLYAPIRKYVENMPWFQKHLRLDPYMEAEMVFPSKNIRVVPTGADADSVLGEAVIWAIMDEANFMAVIANSKRGEGAGRGGKYDQAYSTHSALTRRRNSRFVYPGPSIGKIIVASSSQYSGDFTAKRIKAAQASSAPHTYYIYHKMRFEVMPFDRFCGKKFYVAILNDITGEIAMYDKPSDIPESAIESVAIPVEYRQDFEDDPHGSLRDICGMTTDAITPFFRRREKITEFYEKGAEVGVKSFLVKDNVILGVDGMPMVIKDHRAPMPKRPRFVHIDLSLNNDAVGIGMTRFDGFVEIHRRSGIIETLPVATIELAVSIKPDSLTEIDLAEVRTWVLQLKKKYGYPIRAVTYDGWNSAESIQAWRKMGVKAGVLSVDKTSGPYKEFRNALHDSRVRGYYQDVLISEMSNVEYNAKKDKIDHREGETKDCLDGVVGSYSNMLKRVRAYSVSGNTAADDEEVTDGRVDFGDRYDSDRV